MRRNPSFVKLIQWEHWPSFAYYAPLFPIYLFHSLKAGHPFYFAATNPAIFYSGSGTESKVKTIELLPDQLRPKSILIKKRTTLKEIHEHLKNERFEFPIIAKPDIGFRGYLVKKIVSPEALDRYFAHVDEDIILQEFIPYENELGIFYHRIPGQKQGEITSVTIKKFNQVTGDGQRTLSELIQSDERAYLYESLFSIIHKDRLNEVLEKGESLTLSVIGNHSKGTEFLNGNHLIDKKLVSCIDEICQKLDGWHYGRLDIKYENYEKLLKGEAFKVLEINGIISEPTHIYDATHKDASFFKALRSIYEHWMIMSSIALKNHKENNVPYPSIKGYIKNMLWLRSYSKKLKKLNAKDF